MITALANSSPCLDLLRLQCNLAAFLAPVLIAMASMAKMLEILWRVVLTPFAIPNMVELGSSSNPAPLALPAGSFVDNTASPPELIGR
jgi:hypothetical protein